MRKLTIELSDEQWECVIERLMGHADTELAGEAMSEALELQTVTLRVDRESAKGLAAIMDASDDIMAAAAAARVALGGATVLTEVVLCQRKSLSQSVGPWRLVLRQAGWPAWIRLELQFRSQLGRSYEWTRTDEHSLAWTAVDTSAGTLAGKAVLFESQGLLVWLLTAYDTSGRCYLQVEQDGVIVYSEAWGAVKEVVTGMASAARGHAWGDPGTKILLSNRRQGWQLVLACTDAGAELQIYVTSGGVEDSRVYSIPWDSMVSVMEGDDFESGTEIIRVAAGFMLEARYSDEAGRNLQLNQHGDVCAVILWATLVKEKEDLCGN